MVTADANGMQAIRMDNWKYIDDTPPEGLPLKKLQQLKNNFKSQLYNLEDDPAEQNNLIGANPDKAKLMKKELDKLRMNSSRRN